ncbi:MAG: universal stress protein [Alphaproteobacteria bacterium]|jgi:nucleotide-binding universal stress UspA family protein|nr:universal stress protein [Alphaproteobacteria bacterium]
MFQKILVPTDGSDHAERAVAVASELAAKYDAELIVLHVMEEIGTSRVPVELQSYAKIEHVDVSERDMLEAVANQIVGRAESQAREAGVEAVSHDLAYGSPGPGIVEYAEKHGVDLIVMGRRGLGRVADLFLGSASHRVTQLADCACLTVK